MPTPTENLRPLSTGERFALLAADVLEIMPRYGYTGQVADFAICQAAHETALFTSDLMLRADNFFGMRIANQRPQPWIIGVSNDYAVYADVTGSVCDYFDRQRHMGIPNTDDADVYMDATVGSGYATAGAYKAAWMGLLRQVRATDYATAFRLTGIPDGLDVASNGGDSWGMLLAIGAAVALTR